VFLYGLFVNVRCEGAVVVGSGPSLGSSLGADAVRGDHAGFGFVVGVDARCATSGLRDVGFVVLGVVAGACVARRTGGRVALRIMGLDVRPFRMMGEAWMAGVAVR
jgi:hypothetical protein